MQSVHKSVLLNEVVEHLVFGVWLLDISNNQTPNTNNQTDSEKYIPHIPWLLDGTIGGAGHSLAIAKAMRGRLNIIGLDRDINAINRDAESLKGQAKEVILECENFRNLDKAMEKHSIKAVDIIILDLGLSSDELEASGRGFSFQKDEPLYMTFGDPSSYPFTAKNIVNDWGENVIADVIYGYGEEKFARRIARAIIGYREKKKIETSFELGELVKMAVPGFYRRGKTHPATKTFQALRIAVNDELNALKEGLRKGYDSLAIGGRMAVITFHSLEDRIVKNFYKDLAGQEGGRIITRKPIKPSDQEIAENPRARSAKLRLIEKS